MQKLDRRSLIRTSIFCAGIVFLTQSALAQDHTSDVIGIKYKLPNFPDGTRLLFLGDSITDMKWGRNEKDRNHYLGHSYVFLIASRVHTDLPATKLDFFNRGVSGNTVRDLRKRWQKDSIEMKPDILSILIGVNDVGRACRTNREVDLKQWESDYRFILDASRKANPQLNIVLLDPFVLPVTRLRDKTAWKQWNGECTKLRAIVKQLAADYQAVHIRTQEVFDQACEQAEPSHWIWDGVHPLPQGHELIARSWLESVHQHLEK